MMRTVLPYRIFVRIKGSLSVNSSDDDDNDADNYSLNTLAFFSYSGKFEFSCLILPLPVRIFACKPEKVIVVILDKKEDFGQILLDNQSKAGGLGLENGEMPRESRNLVSPSRIRVNVTTMINSLYLVPTA